MLVVWCDKWSSWGPEKLRYDSNSHSKNWTNLGVLAPGHASHAVSYCLLSSLCAESSWNGGCGRGPWFWPGGNYFLECVRLFGLVFWESLVGADERKRFGGHPRVGGRADGWCRARTLGERPAFVISGSIWSLLEVWPFFFPIQLVSIKCFFGTHRNTFPNSGHIFLALRSHTQQIKTYHLCFTLSQRISESYSDKLICLNGHIDPFNTLM